jgi:hypothetical protein
LSWLAAAEKVKFEVREEAESIEVGLRPVRKRASEPEREPVRMTRELALLTVFHVWSPTSRSWFWMVTVRLALVLVFDSVVAAPSVPSRMRRSPPSTRAEPKVLLRKLRLRTCRSVRSLLVGLKAREPEALENTRSSPSEGAVPPQLPARLQVEEVPEFCQVSVAAGAGAIAPALAATPITRLRRAQREGGGPWRERIGRREVKLLG